MGRTENKPRWDLRFLLRAVVGGFAAAMILLPSAAAVIVLADLKASSFPPISAGIAFLTGLSAGFFANLKSGKPAWEIGAICALFGTIILLTTGFLISSEKMTAETILLTTIPIIFGCFLGAFFGGKGKKLQKRKLFSKANKRRKFT